MPHAYGREFSEIYGRKWDLWSRLMWPFLQGTLEEFGIRDGRWLDLCCGSGSLLALADRRGFETIGVDLSPHQLAQARHRAPNARLYEADIVTFREADSLAVITCLFDSLNYIVEPAGVEAVFQNVAAMLAPGGVFVLDVKTPAAFRREQDRLFDDDQQTVHFRSSYDPGTRLHTFEVVGFVRDGEHFRKFTEAHVQRAYRGSDLRRLARRAGLSCRLLDFENHDPPAPRTERLLCVCRKSVEGRDS